MPFPISRGLTFRTAGFLADLEATYEAQLDKIFYLGPLRHVPQRITFGHAPGPPMLDGRESWPSPLFLPRREGKRDPQSQVEGPSERPFQE